MRLLILILAWYTIGLMALSLILAPLNLEDGIAFTPASVVIGNLLLLPTLFLAFLVIVRERKRAETNELQA